MPEGLTDELHRWVKGFLNIETKAEVNPGAPSDAAAGDAKEAAPGGPPTSGNPLDALGNLARDAADKLGKAADAVTDAITGEEGKLFDAAMKELDAEVKRVADAGLDAGHYAAQAKDIRAEYATAAKLPGRLERIAAISALVTKAQKAASDAKTDVARLGKEAVAGIGSAVTGMRDGAKAQIDKLPKDSKEKPGLVKQLAALDASIAAAEKETDPAKRAKQLKQINTSAEAVFDKAAAAAHDGAAVQAVYSKALKDRYGIEITNSDKTKNTHFDQIYKMFDKVPETDVVQGKLKTLNYQPLTAKGTKNTGASYGGAKINMGDYGAEDWPYQDPKTGKSTPANGFSISTLHELGHSVDDRFGIMSANQGKPGAGAWKQETVDSVAAAFLGQFRSGAGKGVKATDKELLDLAKGMFTGAAAKQPAGMPGDDWGKVKPLLDLCASRRCTNNNWPWASPHDIGGRCYHESYEGRWVSYDTAAQKKKITVRSYQWRAPGEFFAELYAYSFFNSQPPPNGVDATIAQYMYGGKAASDSAPSAKH